MIVIMIMIISWPAGPPVTFQLRNTLLAQVQYYYCSEFDHPIWLSRVSTRVHFYYLHTTKIVNQTRQGDFDVVRPHSILPFNSLIIHTELAGKKSSTRHRTPRGRGAVDSQQGTTCPNRSDHMYA